MTTHFENILKFFLICVTLLVFGEQRPRVAHPRPRLPEPPAEPGFGLGSAGSGLRPLLEEVRPHAPRAGWTGRAY